MRWFRRRRKAFIVTEEKDQAEKVEQAEDSAEDNNPEPETGDSAEDNNAEPEQEEGPKPAAVYDPDKDE
jgi:hypothetical protein